MADGPHEVLTSLLDELGWSPRALARRINHVFGHVFGASPAPYHWRASNLSMLDDWAVVGFLDRRDFLPTLDVTVARQPRPA